MNDTLNFVDLDVKLQQASPQEILEYALNEHENIAISFSGAEDVVLVDMASKIKPGVNVFCLDTGRLHAETYEFINKIRKYYDVNMRILFPESAAVEQLVAEKGLFSFYDDDHKECCGIRKVGPLSRHLLTLDAWVTGQRKDQSPGTRTDIGAIENDRTFNRENETLTKFNPLVNWSSAQVWDYIRKEGVLYNPLHEKGFISIGCQPCTRAILPGQHEREGRWWWEEATQKECGLHSTNLAEEDQETSTSHLINTEQKTETGKKSKEKALSTEGKPRITLVKKILADGSPCKKCGDVIAKLESSGQMDFIDKIVVADERDPESEGMLLAKAHKVDRAPFFIVESQDDTKIYTVYMKFVKEVLKEQIEQAEQVKEILQNNDDLSLL